MKPTPKRSHPNGTRSRVKTGYGDHSSPQTIRKIHFSQKYCPLFSFLKEVNYIKSFFFFSCFYFKHGNMYILGLPLLFCLLKNFQLVKNFLFDYFLNNKAEQKWSKSWIYNDPKKHPKQTKKIK